MASGAGDYPDLPQRRCRILEPGSWILVPAKAPPSAHPFCRASVGGRGPSGSPVMILGG
jgi:hypothetical protein